jgi:hypothetical protein
MPPSPSLVAAASTLADWARERRRTWTDIPLDIPQQPAILADTVELPPDVGEIPALFEPATEMEVPAQALASDVFTSEQLSAFERIQAALTACAVALTPGVKASISGLRTISVIAGEIALRALDALASRAEPAARWLIRGAALVSTISVVMIIAINRGQLFAKWDRMAAMVAAAANRPSNVPAPEPARPSGTGRLTVASSTGEAVILIDGTPRGAAPVTVDLPAGAHRVLVRSPKGSVERAVRIEVGESSEVDEAIFPGWVAFATPIELTVTENDRTL